MSFNLKERQARKIITAEVKSTEVMLEELYSDYENTVSEETMEANLDKQRVNKDPEGTLEAELGSRQTGTVKAVTEEKLNTESGAYTKHRQEVKTDVPLLEEKRLAGDPTEKEKTQKATD